MAKLLIATTGNLPPYLRCADVATGELLNTPPMPTGAFGCALSPDGSFLAVGLSASPNVAIHRTDDWSSVTLSAPWSYSYARDVAFNPAGTLLAVATQSAPGIVVLDMSTLGIVPIASPAGSVGRGCVFSRDGALLAVVMHNSPYLAVYRTSDWSKVSIASMPPSSSYRCSFNHDGSLLAVAHASSPFLTVYNTSNWSKVSGISSPPNIGYGCAFTPSGSLLAVAHASSPFLTVYNTSNWSKVSGTPVLSGHGSKCAFSPNGELLAVTCQAISNLSTAVYRIADWTQASSNIEVAAVAANTDEADVAFSNPPARFLRGVVRDKDGNPASRTLRIFRRSTGMKVAETQSDAVTGDYEVVLYGDFTTEFDAQFMTASGEALNDLFFARATTSEE